MDKLKQVYQEMRDRHIPYDVQWTDIDVMKNHEICTYDNETFPGLPEFIQTLHENNKKYGV